VKYGIAIRNMGPQSTRATIRACVTTAETLGFDAVFVSDHLCIPPDDTEGSGGRYLDVLATLAWIAGVSERIRLGISVLVLPYRPAVLTAKQVATIQELSGGRMILGVGVGWMKPEFEALGVDKRIRGRLSDETLRVLSHLFSHDAEGYRGHLVSFPPFVFSPQPPAPPLWIGGNGASAMRRVVEFSAAGWHPMLTADKLAPALAELKSRLFEKGRADDLEVVVRRGMKFDDLGAARARLDAERAAGATYFILDLGRYPSAEEFAARAETFMAKIASGA
jgi:probable F420-dependent oxidoreductase